MKCSNCGAEVKENVKFCEVCGQPVGDQDPAEVPFVNGQSAGTGGPQKKKSKAPFIACIAVLAAAVVGIVAFAMPMLRKATMKPADFMRYAEEKSRDSGKAKLENSFGQLEKVLNFSDSSRKSVIQVEISDDIKNMLSSYAMLAGVQLPNLSKLNDISIEMQSGAKGDALQSNYTLKANGESLLTAKLYTDFQAKKLYYQIPELSKAYLDASGTFDAAEDTGIAGMLDFSQAMKSGEAFPSAEDAGKIFERYTDILIRSIKDVEKQKDQTCEAEGVSVKADLYTAKYEGKAAAELIKELVNTLKEDEQVIGYLEKTGIDKEEFQSGLEEDLEEYADAEDDKVYVTISDYVSGEEIIGREFKSYKNKEAKEPDTVIQMLMPKDQEKRGFLFYAESMSEEIFKVSGKGILNGTVFEGEFSAESPKLMEEAGQITSGEVFHIKVSDYDVKKAEAEEGTGKIELTMPGIAQLSTFKLVMESSGTMDASKAAIEISMGEQKICNLNILSTKEAAIEVNEPASGDTVYDVTNAEDTEKYLQEMDTEGVLNNIQDKTGIDIKSLLSLYGDDTVLDEDGIVAPGMSADGPAAVFRADIQ